MDLITINNSFSLKEKSHLFFKGKIDIISFQLSFPLKLSIPSSPSKFITCLLNTWNFHLFSKTCRTKLFLKDFNAWINWIKIRFRKWSELNSVGRLFLCHLKSIFDLRFQTLSFYLFYGSVLENARENVKKIQGKKNCIYF